MSWFQKISGIESSLKARDFLRKLKEYGVIIERQNDGSRNILLNTRNNRRTPLHMHNLGVDITPGILKNTLKKLEIDYKEFMGLTKELPEQTNQTEQKETPVPEWQKQPWYLKQKQYAQGNQYNWLKKISWELGNVLPHDLPGTMPIYEVLDNFSDSKYPIRVFDTLLGINPRRFFFR